MYEAIALCTCQILLEIVCKSIVLPENVGKCQILPENMYIALCTCTNFD